jgi:hypothetical protein
VKQISYAEAREIALKRFRGWGIKDLDWQVRNLGFKQFATGIEAQFQHYETGKFRKTYINGCYLPDRPDPSLNPVECVKAKAVLSS